jgi:hypothetical protein
MGWDKLHDTLPHPAGLAPFFKEQLELSMLRNPDGMDQSVQLPSTDCWDNHLAFLGGFHPSD